MGLSMTATHAIWLVAILTAAGVGADHLMEVQPDLREAREAAQRSSANVLQTRTQSAMNCYDALNDKIIFRARNSGDSVIDTWNVTFLVDGVFVPGWLPEVQGVTTGDWRPGEQAFFNVSGITVEQDRVTAQTAEGAVIYSAKVTCP